MANTYVNKVIIGSEVKLDLTQDDITADKLASGIKAHDKSGAPIVGTNTYDADTSDATAVAAEILNGKTAYVSGSKITGTMPNNGAKTLDITDKSTPVTIPMGFHDGSGKAQISSDEQAKLIPTNQLAKEAEAVEALALVTEVLLHLVLQTLAEVAEVSVTSKTMALAAPASLSSARPRIKEVSQ